VRFAGSLAAEVEHRADGAIVMRSTEPLGPYPARLTDRLLHWAGVAPERCVVARRVEGGDGHRVSYPEALASARAIAQALIDRGLSAERPVAVLSENSIDHFLLMLGCMLAGVPIVPVSPAYSLLSQDHSKLRHILGVATPGLVFASHGTPYGRALRAAVAPGSRSCSAAARSRAAPARPSARCSPRGRRMRWSGATNRSARTRWPSCSSPRARPSCPRA
jgi:feruloyl-CoA synthase